MFKPKYTYKQRPSLTYRYYLSHYRVTNKSPEEILAAFGYDSTGYVIEEAVSES